MSKHQFEIIEEDHPTIITYEKILHKKILLTKEFDFLPEIEF